MAGPLSSTVMRRSPPQHLSELRLSCPDSAHLGTYCSRRKPSPANGEAPGLSRRSSFERGNDLPELASSTATTDQHPSNICPCDRGHRLKTSCLLGPAGRLPITSGGRSIDGSGESNPARVGWRRRADRRRSCISLLLGSIRFGQALMHSVRITNRWSGPGQRALLGR